MPRATRATRAKIAATAFLALLLAAGGARAEPHRRESAAIYFDRGAQSYNLGHFQDAITDFEKAYQIEPSPILLFNIAQCQRQLGNADRALFSYRRYLEQAPRAPNRADVTRRIAELEKTVEEEKAAAQARAPLPSPDPVPPAGPPATIVEPARAPAAPAAQPRWSGSWSLGAMAAPAIVRFSRADLESPVVLAARFEVAHGILLGHEAVLRLGLDASFAAVPFTKGDGATGETSSFWGVLAGARVLRRVRASALSLGGGMGAGVLWWSGLSDGNPFTVDRLPSSGPVPLPTLALELRAEYALSRGLFVALGPQLLLSKTTSAGLSQATSAVARFDLTVGFGYAF